MIQEGAGIEQPLVSVIMATYNCEATITDALTSILEQTYPNWELVVCDDGSTDGTWDLLTGASAEFGKRLVLLRNSQNMKLPYSLNRCLDAVSGDLVARMDADDLSAPERLEQQVLYLSANPEVDLVGTAMRRFNDRGPIDILAPTTTHPDKWTLGRERTVPFFHATIMARRRVFEAVANYTVAWRTERSEDLDLWFKFFHAGLVGRNMTQPLYKVREDENIIRRRTARSRWGTYLTMLNGYRLLGSPAKAYVLSTLDLFKIFIPYRLLIWHRAFLSRRSRRARNRVKTVQ